MKTAASYTYNLNEIPEAHRPLFVELNTAIEKAFKKFAKGDNSLTKHNAGYVAVTAEGELVEITQYTDDAPDGLRGWWMVSEYKNAWYGDPRPTLKAIRRSVGL